MYDDRRTKNQNTAMPTETQTETKAVEQIPHPSRSEIELGAVLHALSDPVRLKIVGALAGADQERTCGSFDVPVSKSTCTHHFRVLREAGIIQQRQEGTARLNTLRGDDLEARFPGLLATVLVNAGVFDSAEDYLSAEAAPAATPD
jgi:DNA-binding transcriptional ArsR family regulator